MEAEIQQHLQLVQAATPYGVNPHCVVVQCPTYWPQLKGLLKKLAYDDSAADGWQRLGMSMYEEPKPSQQMIASRLRTAVLLCDISDKDGFGEGCRMAAAAAKKKFEEAASHCAVTLPQALSTRRQHKLPELDLYRELGTEALRLVRTLAGAGEQQVIMTQAGFSGGSLQSQADRRRGSEGQWRGIRRVGGAALGGLGTRHPEHSHASPRGLAAIAYGSAPSVGENDCSHTASGRHARDDGSQGPLVASIAWAAQEGAYERDHFHYFSPGDGAGQHRDSAAHQDGACNMEVDTHRPWRP